MADWKQILGAVLGSIIAGPGAGTVAGYGFGSLGDFSKDINGAVKGTPSRETESSPYGNVNDVLLAINSGKISALEGYTILTKYFPASLALNPNLMKMLNELIARENTANAQDYETYLMQNGLLWNASQLQQLGLSSSGVLQTGASVPNVAAAQTDFSNPAQQNVQALTSLANNFIGMAGRMASAGIYGSALKAVRGTAGRFASQTAHSARPLAHSLKSYSGYGMTWDQMLDDMER